MTIEENLIKIAHKLGKKVHLFDIGDIQSKYVDLYMKIMKDVVEALNVHEQVELKVKLLHPDSKVPVKAHESDACFDCFACFREMRGDECLDTITLNPGQRALVPLGFAYALPRGWEVQVRPRSGLALKKGLTVLNSPGTGDCSFRSELCMIAYNAGQDPITITHGDKICQIKISRVPEVKVSVVESLDETDRNLNGFGSSGNT